MIDYTYLIYDHMIRFPIPYSSMVSLIRGMQKKQSISTDGLGYLTFHPNRPACSIKEGVAIDRVPYFYKQVTTLSKMYTPRQSTIEYRRAVIDIRVWDVGSESIYEVLQIDLCPYGLVDILVHTERNDRLLFHKKFYGLSHKQVQQLTYK